MISGHAFCHDWLKKFLTHHGGRQNEPVCLSVRCQFKTTSLSSNILLSQHVLKYPGRLY